MTTYLGYWSDKGQEGMLYDFGIEESALADYEVLVAGYDCRDYDGSAFVLLRSKATGSLWEVNGSHCSCHGLNAQDYHGDEKTQFQPEPVDADVLLHRLENGHWTWTDELRDAVRAALEGAK